MNRELPPPLLRGPAWLPWAGTCTPPGGVSPGTSQEMGCPSPFTPL